MYNYADVVEKSREYFNGAELPAKVFADKYALRDNEGNIYELTPDDMHKRMAKEFARIEAKKFKKPLSEEKIYNYFKHFKKFIPQGSPMMGIGNKFQISSLSNCFVLESPHDSYGGILHTDQQLVQIAKRRGGNGIDLDNLRPTGTVTKNSSRTSTGISSWMTRYSNSTREVGQGGRRGALMLTLSVHHPDILIFATIKNDDIKVTGANISIKLTDEFLRAVENNEEYEQRWPVNSSTPVISKMVSAREVWKTIIHSAWLRAEPGLLFWDNILKESPADCYADVGYRTVSTNPCGELPLSMLDSCRLFAINLLGYVKNPYGKYSSFDYTTFYKDVQIAQRLLDDLVDLELEMIDTILEKIENDNEPGYIKSVEQELWEKIRTACAGGRRTGLGITCLGDTLAAIGLRYGSETSICEVERIYTTLKLGSYRASVDMAKELGTFPVWNPDKESDCPFFSRFKNDILTLDDEIVYGDCIWKEMMAHGRRNISNLTTAPTGSVSIMACMEINGKRYHNLTSGIEPMIMASYERKKKGNPGDKNFRADEVDKLGDSWMKFEVYHAGIEAWMDVTGEKDITKSPYYGAASSDINWENRVKMQAAAQRHVDHSISSTVNLPNNVSEEEVAKIYETAWRSGCKGITVYRDGCRSGVLVKKDTGVPKHSAPERPKELQCDVHHITVKGKPYFVLVGLINNGIPYEVFAGKNGFIDKSVKTGKIIKLRKGLYKAILDDETEISPVTAGCDEHEEALSRLTSLLLRYNNIPIHTIVEQLNKVEGDINSFARSIGKAIKKYIVDGTKSNDKCQECNMQLIFEAGCIICKNCGWSKC